MNFGIGVANPGAVCERRNYTTEPQARQAGNGKVVAPVQLDSLPRRTDLPLP
jgi:hypothetical protein